MLWKSRTLEAALVALLYIGENRICERCMEVHSGVPTKEYLPPSVVCHTSHSNRIGVASDVPRRTRVSEGANL